MDKIVAIYQQMISEGNADPEQNARIAAIWKKTASMTDAEYKATLKPLPDKYGNPTRLGTIPDHQMIDSPENAASKERFKEYLRQHAHSIGSGNVYLAGK